MFATKIIKLTSSSFLSYSINLIHFYLKMKKLLFFAVLLVWVASLESCGSRKKGCGLTADNQNVPVQQEVVVSEVTE